MIMNKKEGWDSRKSVKLLASEAGVDRIGELAVKRGYVSVAQRDECLRELTRSPEKMLGQILVQKAFLKASHFALLLREQLRRVPLYRRIGRYALEDVLGEGSSGVVFLARDNLLGRSVALKVLHTDHPLFDQRVRDFKREANHCARLSHPNIVAIHDAGQEGNFCYIAMERIEGKPLSEWSRQERGEWGRMGRVFEQVARAVHHAHERGIIHRDVKPDNILVGPDDRASLVDFSLAKVMEEGELGEAGGSLVGTPAFMSPEQMEGSRDAVDARSDIFSLGVTMYESLTGKLPFRGSTLRKLKAAIQERSAAPLEGVPGVLGLIALRAMEKLPQDRFQTMLELAEELARFNAPPSSRKEEVGRFGFAKRLMNWVRGR